MCEHLLKTTNSITILPDIREQLSNVVFSLGFLSGVLLQDSAEVIHNAQHREPVRPSQIREDVPDFLDTACMKALSKKRSDRFSSAIELATVVEQ